MLKKIKGHYNKCNSTNSAFHRPFPTAKSFFCNLGTKPSSHRVPTVKSGQIYPLSEAAGGRWSFIFIGQNFWIHYLGLCLKCIRRCARQWVCRGWGWTGLSHPDKDKFIFPCFFRLKIIYSTIITPQRGALLIIHFNYNHKCDRAWWNSLIPLLGCNLIWNLLQKWKCCGNTLLQSR